MTTLAIIPRRAVQPVLPMLLAQTKAELIKKRCNPMFAVFAVGFPILLFVLLGLPRTGDVEAGAPAARYVLASFASYGCISIMLFSFGAAVAAERGQRMNVLTRATPLRPAVDLLARMLSALVFEAAMLLLLLVVGVVVGNVSIGPVAALTLGVRLALGSLPFMALGYLIGYRATPSAAPVVTNVVFFLLSFASGFYAPISQMGTDIQHLAPYLPSYRLGELGWDAAGAQTADSMASSVLWLGGYGLIFALLAVWAYRREEQHTFE